MKIAVVGATGLVGSELIRILHARGYDLSALTPVASRRSAGADMGIGGSPLRVVEMDSHWYPGQDIVFFVTDTGISREEIPKLKGKVPLIIDNSSVFRMDPDVPLVVPQVNPESAFLHKGLIANPNCSTIQLVVAINPLHRLSPVKKIIVSTYQAASGAGKTFMDEFWSDAGTDAKKEPARLATKDRTLAFNLLPTIDVMTPDGFSREEEKIMQETRKILSREIVQVAATAVRVPVMNAHSEAVYLETADELDLELVKNALSNAPGVTFIDDFRNAPTPREVTGTDNVYVGRLRKDRDVKNGIHMWVVADNLRKGAALNAVEISSLFTQ